VLDPEMTLSPMRSIMLMHWDPGVCGPPRILPVEVWHPRSTKGWNSQLGAPARTSILESSTGAGTASAVATKTKAERRAVNCIFSD